MKVNCICEKAQCNVSSYNGFNKIYKLSIIWTKLVNGVRVVAGVFRTKSDKFGDGNCEIARKIPSK